MPNPFFRFKQFTVYHDRCAMKVTTDACLFGAWCAAIISNGQYATGNALEIGTGTGLLSLMVAQKNKIEIEAVEIEASAAAQALENVTASLWKENIHIHQADILHFQSEKQYNFIISNPPFYEKEIVSASDKKNLAHHGHGLKLETLFEIINSLLKQDSFFFLLLPYKRVKEIERYLKATELSIIKKTIVRQSVRHQPFRFMLMGTNRQINVATEENEISIWDASQEYSQEFIDLLKDYYMYL